MCAGLIVPVHGEYIDRCLPGVGCVRVLEVLVKLNQRTYTYNNGGG